jgi:ribosomal protein S18 acetylase RimI-like enzyme
MINSMSEVLRIQAFLRANARRQYQSLTIPFFTLFFHPSDSNMYFNYAIPDQALVAGEFDSQAVRTAIEELRTAYQQRGLTARLEFFEAFAPALPELLAACGFEEESRNWSMLCPAGALRPAAPVSELEVVRVDGSSPERDLVDFITAQRQGFNPDDLTLPSPQAVQNARHDLSDGGWTAYLGRVYGEPASVAVFSRPLDGVSEIAGVATRSSFRRRGIGSCLTARATADAFALGAQTACLTAADERAGRIYERLGFEALSMMVAYRAS